MATVVATAMSQGHTFTKQTQPFINLVQGLGVEGDCHSGKDVQHRSRLHIKPPPANLRQVHLIQNEILLDHDLVPAEIGENITTRGIDLLALPRGTKLHFVDLSPGGNDILVQEHPVITITGLRNPCPQIEKHRKGLQEVFIERNNERKIIARKAGVMSIVETGGIVTPGMKIIVEEPTDKEALGCV